jgi:Mg2+-importing ATPase
VTQAQDAQQSPPQLELAAAAALSSDEVLRDLGSSGDGLSSTEARARLERVGPNALRSHSAGAVAVFVGQLRNPFLLLLLGTAVASAFFGERTDAIIIFLISGLSVGLGFVSEYRSARAVEALHSQLRHTIVALREGAAAVVDVTELVPGDVVRVGVGDVVPADLRLLEAEGLECDESVLTGESVPAEKNVEPVTSPESRLELPSCAFMGTVVRAGSGVGVVVQTGGSAEFGRIATQLGEGQPQTAFQLGLRDFSILLVRFAGALSVTILIVNIALGRSVIQSLLFALSISIGLTPQLLPAIVSVSLSTGARRLAERKVIVKRLVAIEDFGNIEVFFTDKTGTLTEGRIRFAAALDTTGAEDDAVFRDGLLCSDAVLDEHGAVVGGPALDQALWTAPGARTTGLASYRRLAERPFDYERRIASVLVDGPGETRMVIVKGAPELVLARCRDVPPKAQSVLDAEFARGSRVVAVATRNAPGATALSAADEDALELAGFLTFVDPPKADAADAIARLHELGVEVKVITGDNDRVAGKVCGDLALPVRGTLTGTELDALDDAALAAALPQTTVFARVTPEQKSRVINAQRALGSTVGFMGDGVNDAVALHDADVGISVDSATDVAKDAADIVLLEKDLDILATGIGEGRRILLNNLLYDTSQLTIPTDHVDEEQLRRPAHWDIAMIRRFMLFFGPISSLFDFGTFAILLLGFDASHTLFRSGWFIESLATQSLAIFAIRTRRVPFFRSRSSTALTASTLVVVAIAFALPFSPLAHTLGFTSLPAGLVVAIVAIVPAYLLVLELAKRVFYRREAARPSVAPIRRPPHEHRVLRRAARWRLRRPAPSTG